MKAAGGKVTGVDFAESAKAVNDYLIALLKEAPNADAGKAFIELVKSAEGTAGAYRGRVPHAMSETPRARAGARMVPVPLLVPALVGLAFLLLPPDRPAGTGTVA